MTNADIVKIGSIFKDKDKRVENRYLKVTSFEIDFDNTSSQEDKAVCIEGYVRDNEYHEHKNARKVKIKLRRLTTNSKYEPFNVE